MSDLPDVITLEASIAALPDELVYVEVADDGLVPVISAGKNIGFARVYRQGIHSVCANVYLVYSCPERFDIENGRELYVLPDLHFSGYGGLSVLTGQQSLKPTKIHVRSLSITPDNPSNGATPLERAVLC